LCGEETFVAAAGSTAVLPRGIPHRFRNETDAPARAIVHCTPGGFETFFLDIDRLANPGPAENS
jgi:quercetin dioxygenase-like cupin family protein